MRPADDRRRVGRVRRGSARRAVGTLAPVGSLGIGLASAPMPGPAGAADTIEARAGIRIPREALAR